MVMADRYSREHAEPLEGALPPLALDRHRIVNSAAFRRLQYKTQVFVSPGEDHFRTRMTHTLEVAHLARLLATALKLDADLAEVVALAHDLGHPPFGHAGERALAACMAEYGGYEHNAHSLRVVEQLEHPYPSFPGLNLTRAVRECLAKHTTQYDQPGPHALQDGRPPPPESQAAALADRLAYALHDLQDGVYAGLIEPEALNALELWREASQVSSESHVFSKRENRADPAAARRQLRPTIDHILRRLMKDLVKGSRDGAVRLSAEREKELTALGEFLLKNVYQNERLIRMDHKGRRILTAVFEAYVDEPRLLPPRYHKRVAEQGVHRVACDYVAGMTDRFCQSEHARLFDPRMEA